MYKTASIIKKLCIRDGITIKEVEKQIGLSNGSIMKWESSSPKIENLEKVANYFKVPLECLIGKPCAIECDVCGYDYVANCNSSELAHEKRHKKCLAAISKFGFWWSLKKRERLKANARNKINYEKLTVAEKINEYEVVFKSHFSRSVESSQFNLTHPCLNEFIAMLLYQKQFYNKIDNETYNALVNKYGKKPGISEGTTYYICDADSRTPMYSRKKHSTIIVSLDNLFKRMKELNVSKNMLSDEIGVSTETVNNWRNGQSTPNTIKISMIADYLDCSVDYLLGRTDSPVIFRQKGSNKMTFYQRIEKVCHDHSISIEKIKINNITEIECCTYPQIETFYDMYNQMNKVLKDNQIYIHLFDEIYGIGAVGEMHTRLDEYIKGHHINTASCISILDKCKVCKEIVPKETLKKLIVSSNAIEQTTDMEHILYGKSSDFKLPKYSLADNYGEDEFSEAARKEQHEPLFDTFMDS